MTAPQRIRELWRPVAGFEGRYEVSSQGRVRSLDMLVPKGKGGCAGLQTRRGRILRQHLRPTCKSNPRYFVWLYSAPKKPVCRAVHRLVAEAFPELCGIPADAASEVDHLDTDRLNNRADNLRWRHPASNRALRNYHYYGHALDECAE